MVLPSFTSAICTPISASAPCRICFGLVGDLKYDICVLTGDYRGKTFGPFDKSLEYIDELRRRLTTPVYAVLGNHGQHSHERQPWKRWGSGCCSTRAKRSRRRNQTIYLAGVDDAHFLPGRRYREGRGANSKDAFSILLSHTPEIYQQAANEHFDVMLSGHTHGGQLCLPVGFRSAGSDIAEIDERRRLALRRDGRLHVGGRRHQRIAGPTELSHRK
jgi:predicted MPP superfamily phosphohydrolase